MNKQDLITSLSHYNTFNFIHWHVCISDGTVGYVLDTNPAYDRIVESWRQDYGEDEFVDFIMEVSACNFDIETIQSKQAEFQQLRILDGKDFEMEIFGETYDSYYCEDMLDDMMQIRLISQFAKDLIFRTITIMNDRLIPSWSNPFSDHSQYILDRSGAWSRAEEDYAKIHEES